MPGTPSDVAPEGWPRISSALFYDDPAAPRALGGANTQSLFVFVDDVEAHCARARAAGARIVTEPADKDYGEHEDRGYSALDCEGHHWWFAQRLGPRAVGA